MHTRRVLLAAIMAPLLLLPPALAAHDNGTGPRSLGGATIPQDVSVALRIEAEDFAQLDVGARAEDAEATGGTAWRMERYGTISTSIDVAESGVMWVRVRARGEHAPDLMTTHMHPVINGEQRGEWDVGPRWDTFLQTIPVLAGTHTLTVDNFNNYHAPADDRTLVVDWVEVTVTTQEGAPRVGEAPEAVVDGPDIHAAGTGMPQFSDADARDGTSWHMWGIGCFVEAIVFDHENEYQISMRLRGNERGGVGSHTLVKLNGQVLDEFHAGDAWMERDVDARAAAGVGVLEICYDNDYGGEEKRNLWLDELRVTRLGETPATPPPATTPTPAASTPPPQPTGETPTTPMATASPPPTSVTDAPETTPSPEEAAAVPAPALVGLLAMVGVAALTRRRAG